MMLASRPMVQPSMGRPIPQPTEAGFMRWLAQQPNPKMQTSGRSLNKGDVTSPRAKWDVGGHTPGVSGPALPIGINPMYDRE